MPGIVTHGTSLRLSGIIVCMKNPFPGMNPYLEARWYDFHTRFAAHAAEQLNDTLPADLVANTEERVAVEHEGIAVSQAFRPDVQVEQPEGAVPDSAEPGGVLTAQAVKLVIAEPATERFIEIREAKTERIVTVIEIVSPSNKRSPGLRAYRKKRQELLNAGVSMVEIDLVRRGNWEALLLPHTYAATRQTYYRATTRFASEPAAVYLRSFPLREPLPKLPIPLRRDDATVFLDVQPLVDAVYERGRCWQTVDYTKPPPEPALAPEDAAWCDELLRQAKLRA